LISLVKLMSKYNLASNHRSRQAVEDVLRVLKSPEFDGSEQLKVRPRTTMECITHRLNKQPIWMIIMLHTTAVLLVDAVLQTMNSLLKINKTYYSPCLLLPYQ
jgi:uncharacterized protein (DUF2267 family)